MSRFGIPPRVIIHVGANRGQEFEAYKACGAKTAVYIEPIGHLYDHVAQLVASTPGHHAIRAVCSNRAGDLVDPQLLRSRRCDSR